MIDEELNDCERSCEILKALGHPIRLRIVAALLRGYEGNVNALAAYLDIPQSTASQHIGVLKRCGIIDHHKKGVDTYYSVIDEKVKRIVELLQED